MPPLLTKPRARNSTLDASFAGRIFMEDAAGVAVASLGQIVEGYAVVFGASNALNLRRLGKPAKQSYLRFVRAVRDVITARFGPAVMFEHGAASPGTNTGCGVDRLHIHIVPYTGASLNDHLQLNYRCVAKALTIEQTMDNLRPWRSDTPYFWIEEEGRVFLFSYGEQRESQIVRRAIAQQCGTPERWNWREFPTHNAAELLAKELLASCGLPGSHPPQITLV